MSSGLWFRILSLAAVVALPASLGAQNQEFRAWFADAWGQNFWTAAQTSQYIADARAGGFNAIIPQIRRRGDALYHSKFEPQCHNISAGYDPLADLIAKAHNTNNGPYLEVHAWVVAYHAWKATTTYPLPPQANHALNLHPDWRLKDINGTELIDGQYTFDPGHPEVQRHTFNVCMDIITNYNVDGLNFDYIRYSSTREGYNEATVARFNQRFSRTGTPAAGDAAWKQFRRDQVTALLRKVYLNAIAVRPEVKISCDTVTWYPGPANDNDWYNSSGAYTAAMQDWRGWMQEGILDLNLPMAYFDQAGSYTRDWTNWCNFARDRQFNRHAAINAGTYLNSLGNAIVQLRYTRADSPSGNRTAGACVYDYGTPAKSVTRASFINALVNPSAADPVTPPIYSIPAAVPSMPWKVAPTKGHLMGYVYGESDGNPLDGAIVTLTGPVSRIQTNDATGFYGFVDLPPGSYTVRATFPGYSNATAGAAVTAGIVSTKDLVAPWNGAPSILNPPQDQTVVSGSNALFSVIAAGAPVLGYQWFFEGTNRLAATNDTLTLAAVTEANAGRYTVVVTNSLGAVTSAPAVLQITPPPPPSRLLPLWSLAPGSRPYLTVNSLANERGMACNPVSGRLLVVSRVNPNVYALDGDTGTDLHQLDLGGVTGGYSANYQLLMIGAAEDGAVYAGNLTLAPASVPFRLYRWPNDNPGTAPSIAYSGDPSPGSAQRWGDTLAVRGAGKSTQILIGSRSGNLVVLFTTTNGVSFAPHPITVGDAPTGSFGLGLAFGVGETFWGKATGTALRQVFFDLGAGTGAVLRAHGNPEIPNSMAPLGANPSLNMLAGIHVASPNHLRLYDLSDLPPALLATNLFPTDNDNSGTGTGAVDFHGDRVYALDSNNGLLAMRIALPPVITSGPSNRVIKAGGAATFAVEASSSTPVSYQWRLNGIALPDGTRSNYSLARARTNQAGIYSVALTNQGGFATAQAELTVLPPTSPSLLPVARLTDGVLEFESAGDPGIFSWQTTTNLATGPWLELTNFASPDGRTRLRISPTNDPRGFFRLLWNP